MSAGASETVNQTSLSTLGLKLSTLPSVVGPYSYTTVNLSASQTLFSIEAVERLRAARERLSRRLNSTTKTRSI